MTFGSLRYAPAVASFVDFPIFADGHHLAPLIAEAIQGTLHICEVFNVGLQCLLDMKGARILG